MPEGDTIHRTAAALGRVLVGRQLERTAFPRLVGTGPAPGTHVEDASARGKHLLVGFDDGTVLHTHLRMHGAWHVALRGDGPAGRSGNLVAALVTADHIAACYDAPVVELLDRARLDRHPVLSSLGPDLAVAGVDLQEVGRRRLRARADVPLVASLLDQRIASGVGNVYASELAFHARTHPFTAVSALAPAVLDDLYAQAAVWLQDNVSRSVRTTVPNAPEGSLWVYDRHGRPCRVCRTPIRAARQGDGARPTWWCPSCQPSPTAASPSRHRPTSSAAPPQDLAPGPVDGAHATTPASQLARQRQAAPDAHPTAGDTRRPD